LPPAPTRAGGILLGFPSSRREGAFPGSLYEGAGSPIGLTEGVSFDEWYSVKYPEFRRGDENRPYPRILASTRLNGTSSRNFPAPSLRELARPQGLT